MLDKSHTLAYIRLRFRIRPHIYISSSFRCLYLKWFGSVPESNPNVVNVCEILHFCNFANFGWDSAHPQALRPSFVTFSVHNIQNVKGCSLIGCLPVMAGSNIRLGWQWLQSRSREHRVSSGLCPGAVRWQRNPLHHHSILTHPSQHKYT